MPDTVSILLVGAGGLGTPAAWAITESWNNGRPLRLTIADPDIIERSNLNRQILFGESDIGRSKAEVLASRLQEERARGVDIQFLQTRVDEENIVSLLKGVDLVLECTDSPATKFLLNDFCLQHSIAFCYGGAVSRRGQLLWRPSVQGACLRCVYGDWSDSENQETSCRQAGILGPVAGMLGSLQGQLASAIASPTELENNSLFLNLPEAALEFRESRLAAQPDCPLSHYHRDISTVDLRAKRCPDTLVFAKLALERIAAGDRLLLRFGNPDSRANVSRSLAEEGYRILKERTGVEEEVLVENQLGQDVSLGRSSA